MAVYLDSSDSYHNHLVSQFKKRKVISDGDNGSLVCSLTCLPTLQASDYFMEPSLSQLITRELTDPGYCARVQNFTVGRYGYGNVRFFGETDVRWLDLDQIVKFRRHEIVVYEDETVKPSVGKGLNKAAEVTLILQKDSSIEKLKLSAENQGAEFISFDTIRKEWKFSVQHFSRFGLSDDEEDDVMMDDADVDVREREQVTMNDNDGSDLDEGSPLTDSRLLSHSLPSHLGLDPVRMKEMRMMMFSPEEEEDDAELDNLNGTFSHHRPLHGSKTVQRSSPLTIRKTPLALLEYNPGSFASSDNGSILLSQQNKGVPLTITKVQGFKLEIKETPVTKSYSKNIVDAGLLMGRSFGIAWGPNNLLIHCGSVGDSNKSPHLSSTISLEKVATDNVVRDENNKIREELIGLCFDSPLSYHKEINFETNEFIVDSYKLKARKLVFNRLDLSHVCRQYIGIIEKQLEVPGLSSSARVMLMHQVFVWELINVLFSSKESSIEADVAALPLIRRAEFSVLLQESVCHRVQDEISSLNDSKDLQQLFLLLTGRQIDAAVELSASRGDVRLACLLTQAGGSTVNRMDIDRQLDLWKTNSLDFGFIENDRIRLFELLAGNIHGALGEMDIDWKRFLGLLMWYHLQPASDLTSIFQTYQHLLEDGRAPYPVPVYIDEKLVMDKISWSPGNRFDLAYYLMILHSNEGRDVTNIHMLKTMFSAFASTHDPLDHHMIWHQRAVLEAVGTFSCDDLHVLDMGFVSQLLNLGHCHWALYVVLHMSHRDDYPYLQASVIREILFQYCETWSAQENQRQFIVDLGVPSAWLHEALAVYHAYNGNSFKALEHYLGCGFWQKAHSTFITSVAHSLFMSGKQSEILRLATSMEDHKSEIENWDLGAGIFITFYSLKSSLKEDDSMTELVSLQDKNDACRKFFSRLKGSLAFWEGRLPIDARTVYAKMAEQISDLLVADPGEGSTTEVKLDCFNTIFDSPVPQDLLSSHLQSAISHFTLHLTEAAS
ncbi:putative nuclear protein [Helianthus annuus]|uniref:Nuclear protein n=1 Tax=Helianthus annuus TaxID=4232 RepID=A0A251V8B6_HELAN|nr:nuclear pore complex protein NUP96 [Helianthus annuus]KAF5817049.1 putative nuclear protein [Helianthus annuus]KAJ0603572.1 putative nuclear protein [Helianthus annuus]KAJ0613686.1 putative nuclear protein [Helianthus annuus]KAJ0617492.1 putative nuclear protein [Helianthus annuus]KAJ0776030.1 putative nuclear protein [Helianthus annuus]